MLYFFLTSCTDSNDNIQINDFLKLKYVKIEPKKQIKQQIIEVKGEQEIFQVFYDTLKMKKEFAFIQKNKSFNFYQKDCNQKKAFDLTFI